jgi:hypothetical protein
MKQSLVKILSIGSSQFLRGKAISPYEENIALFDVADGIDFFRNPGLLCAGASASDIGLTGVTATVTNFIPSVESGVGYLYGISDKGNLYKVNTASNAVTDVTDQINNVASVGQGIDIGEGLGASAVGMCYTENIMVRGNKIPPAVASDVSAGSLTTSPYHPVHFAFDKNFYIGDINELDKWNGCATATTTQGVLDLSSDLTITNITDDGYYLVVGATNNPTQTVGRGVSKVLFWDTWSPSWNREWAIPDRTITALLRKGRTIYAFGGRCLWELSYDNEPKALFTNDQVYLQPYIGGVGIIDGQLIWSSNTNLATYGTPDSRLSPILATPYGGMTAPNGVGAIQKNKLYVGDNKKLLSLNTGNYGATATTSLIDLKNTYKIVGVKIVTKALASGDSLTVNVMNEAGTNIITGTFSYTQDGAVGSKKIWTLSTASVLADQIIIQLAFTGAVKIKRIDVFGELWPITYSEK